MGGGSTLLEARESFLALHNAQFQVLCIVPDVYLARITTFTCGVSRFTVGLHVPITIHCTCTYARAQEIDYFIYFLFCCFVCVCFSFKNSLSLLI